MSLFDFVITKPVSDLIITHSLRHQTQDIVFHSRCKCQYKIVGFLSYKNVGKPTRLYDILCNLIFFNHILHLIL